MATLLLVDDHTMFRAGIRALVERSGAGHVIVGEAADGLAAVRAAQQENPDIILMDVAMPRANGIEATRTILKTSSHPRVIMLSMHADPAYVTAALDAGASAYVLKDAVFGDLEAAIRSVLAGHKYLSAGLRAGMVTLDRSAAGPSSRRVTLLSPRERQVLQLIAEANSSAEIARNLGLKVRTVETYRQSIMDKLNLHSAAALTAFAIQHGISSTHTIPRT